MIKNLFVLGIVFFSITIVAQEKDAFKLGQTTLEELKMTTYDKDVTANEVILFEQVYIKTNAKKRHRYTKEHYLRKKILNKSALDNGGFRISYYGSSRIDDFEAIVYNLSPNGEVITTKLSKDAIKEIKYDKELKFKTFALPNIKVGSVIEYRLKFSSNSYGVFDWHFQSGIPKKKTVYIADLPNSVAFNIRLMGFLKPSYYKVKIKEKCISVYKCRSIHYEMVDVPAFEEENYSTTKENYISRLSFEKKYYNPYVKKGENQDWRALDKVFKRVIDYRIDKSSFYKRKLPKSILKESDGLTRAKKVYHFIKNHFTLAQTNTDYNLEGSFKHKIASAGTINLSLYYAMKAANINAKVIMLSTRSNGLVTKLHATLEGFNYELVSVDIKGKKFFLDATDKLAPFGLIPFKCLNGEGREIDFILGSSWKPITPSVSTMSNTKLFLTVGDEMLTGKMKIKRTGYEARNTRRKILDKTYLNALETTYPNMELSTHKFKNIDQVTKPLYEEYELNFELDQEEGIVKFNPFLIERLSINPFKLKKRLYPVDYGYARNNTYILSLTIPKEFEVVSIPENKMAALPNKGGKFILNVKQEGNTITLYFKHTITKAVFATNEYAYLKEFYNQLIKSQDTFIELKKK